MPTTPNNWLRYLALAALALGVIGLFWAWALTNEIQRIGLLHPSAVASYMVQDRWYVAPSLGLKRNLVLIVSAAAVLIGWFAAFRRELRFFFIDRYLPQK